MASDALIRAILEALNAIYMVAGLIRGLLMPIPNDADSEKLAEVALAILWLGAHRDKRLTRVWKSMDWDLTDMLFEKGWISNPTTKAQSVVLTDEAEKLAEELFRKHFTDTQ